MIEKKHFGIAIVLLLVIYIMSLSLLNQCYGGPTYKHDCYTINDGRGNESCIDKCGDDYYVSEEYCVDCQDCMMCYYGCDEK